ncbi:ABC transporter permease [Phytohabitans sp. ZYX-F-186]|uniref:ABC transporter permease n=1 Tax=Phytohabitans maris TaxID=3071409 RepID=A0ABU0ZPE4_9ACTN|nr:ABC transporter permease [Phytohabitans sp. ZYX-F-186]MDQ7908908.1 ABC transporter permease [Phytohabitans sp. ZYX-F-186]
MRTSELTDPTSTAEGLPEEEAPPRRRAAVLRELGWMPLAGFAVVAFVIVVAALAPWIMPHDPLVSTSTQRFAGPSAAHWFGTDGYSRDVFSRMLLGSRVSIFVGFVVTATVLLVGGVLGLVAGYAGGLVDSIVGRIVDVLLAVPGILLAIAIVAFLGPGIQNVCIAISIHQLPAMVRVVRGATLSVRKRPFVRAGRAVGMGHTRLLLRHIGPFVLGVAMVQATLGFADAVLYEAALSYLGIGVQLPEPTWGNMISEAQSFLTRQPLNAIFPGLGLTLLLLGVNFLGDGLRDVFDPEGRYRS